MQQENRSYWLPNRVALVTTLGLALLGTPAIVFAAENGVPATTDTASVLTTVQSQDARSTVQPDESQVAETGTANGATPKAEPQAPASSSAETSPTVTGTTEENTANAEQQPTVEMPASSQQQEAQE
ncbi:hypothetical protein, partial [Tractidigestivibacter sp.]